MVILSENLMLTVIHDYIIRESVNSRLDYWTGLLDWTTGLIFDLKFIPKRQTCEGKALCVCRKVREWRRLRIGRLGHT